MDPNQALADARAKLAAATEHFKQELAKIRTGRAHPGMLDGITVEAYGQNMPLKSLAGITAPEAQLLQVTPFDPNNLKAISDAIRNDQSLGLSPTDDGKIVRIQIPPLTTETRQQMTRLVGQKVEETMITVRQVRHDAINRAEAAEKNKEIGRDELERFKKQMDELTANQKAEADKLAEAKNNEILTV